MSKKKPTPTREARVLELLRAIEDAEGIYNAFVSESKKLEEQLTKVQEERDAASFQVERLRRLCQDWINNPVYAAEQEAKRAEAEA